MFRRLAPLAILLPACSPGAEQAKPVVERDGVQATATAGETKDGPTALQKRPFPEWSPVEPVVYNEPNNK